MNKSCAVPIWVPHRTMKLTRLILGTFAWLVCGTVQTRGQLNDPNDNNYLDDDYFLQPVRPRPMNYDRMRNSDIFRTAPMKISYMNPMQFVFPESEYRETFKHQRQPSPRPMMYPPPSLAPEFLQPTSNNYQHNKMTPRGSNFMENFLRNPMIGQSFGKFRVSANNPITDELNTKSAIVVKKTSGPNPPPLPLGFDNLPVAHPSNENNDDDYDDDADKTSNRRTLGPILELLNGAGGGRGGGGINGQSQSDINSELMIERERDRLADLKFQAQLDQIRSQNEIASLKAELRRPDKSYSREVELQAEIDRLNNLYRFDEFATQKRIIDIEDEITRLEQERYYRTNREDRINTRLTFNRPSTTRNIRTNVSFRFPVLG